MTITTTGNTNTRGGHIYPAAQCPRTLRPRPTAPWDPAPGAIRWVLGACGTADKGDMPPGSPGSIILHGKLLENNWKITGQPGCAVVESQ